jgi:hypothetical protein
MKQIALLPFLGLLVVSHAMAQEERAAKETVAEQPETWVDTTNDNTEEISPLDDLAWMVGQWVDRGEDVTITTNCSWTKNRKFLTRSFRVEMDEQVTLEGTQVVGWDSIERRIFGEGRWIQDRNRWLVKTSFVLASGERASALNVITYVDPNTLRWQSIDREIGGELQPSIPEVTVVRRKADDSDSQAVAKEEKE